MKARFIVRQNTPDVLAIIDCNDGAMSVTNDAEAVVANLAIKRLLKNTQRLIYKDTDGRWDELKHRNGLFQGFKPLGATSLADAIAKLK